METKPKRPRDTNQLAKMIADLSVGEATEATPPSDARKNQAAVELGRLGGQKGGLARARNLSKKKLSAIGKKGAKARWSSK